MLVKWAPIMTVIHSKYHFPNQKFSGEWTIALFSTGRKHLDYFTVSLHRPNSICLALELFKGIVVAWKNYVNSHQSRESAIHCDQGNPNQYLVQPITNGWCQPFWVHVPKPTDSPTVTRLGLCSCLENVHLARKPGRGLVKMGISLPERSSGCLC